MLRLSKTRKLKIIKDNIEPYIPQTTTFIKINMDELYEILLQQMDKCYENIYELFYIGEKFECINYISYSSIFEYNFDNFECLIERIVSLYDIIYDIKNVHYSCKRLSSNEINDLTWNIVNNLHHYQLIKINRYILCELNKYLCKDVLTIMNEYIQN